jgi:uncharacterized protein
MFSLKKLFGKEDPFYVLLEASADEAKASISLLSEYVRDHKEGKNGSLDEFIQSRRKDKKITQQIREELAKTFVTPFEREDIEALSHALYRIPKSVEKVVERLSIHKGRLNYAGVERQIELLVQAAAAVEGLVKSLRKHAHAEQIADLQNRLQYAEGEADKVMLSMIADLYNGPYDAKETLFLKDIYEMIEKVIDRCRDAGSVASHIVLKYS